MTDGEEAFDHYEVRPSVVSPGRHQKSLSSFSGSKGSCRPADSPHPLPWSQGVGARIHRINELDELALRTLKSATLPCQPVKCLVRSRTRQLDASPNVEMTGRGFHPITAPLLFQPTGSEASRVKGTLRACVRDWIATYLTHLRHKLFL